MPLLKHSLTLSYCLYNHKAIYSILLLFQRMTVRAYSAHAVLSLQELHSESAKGRQEAQLQGGWQALRQERYPER